MMEVLKVTCVLGWFAGLYANEPLIFIPCAIVMIGGALRELSQEMSGK